MQLNITKHLNKFVNKFQIRVFNSLFNIVNVKNNRVIYFIYYFLCCKLNFREFLNFYFKCFRFFTKSNKKNEKNKKSLKNVRD